MSQIHQNEIWDIFIAWSINYLSKLAKQLKMCFERNFKYAMYFLLKTIYYFNKYSL